MRRSDAGAKPASGVSVAAAFVRVARAPVAAAGVVLAIDATGSDLPSTARLALTVFALAVVGWILTPLHDALVAALAALGMVAVVGLPDAVAAAATGDLIILMMGSFLLAAALQRGGWLDRLVDTVANRAGSVRALFHGLAAVMITLSFIIPSTAARAAMMVPVVAALTASPGGDPRLRRALALLAATTILLSAFASLLGAGAHVVAVELLAGMTGESIGFARWVMLGLPLAAASVFISAEVILRLFLTPAERSAPPPRAERERATARPAVLAIVIATMLGWLTAPLHGVSEGQVALAGALAVMSPGVRTTPMSTATRDVDWRLLLFMAATALLAHGLVASGLGAAGLGHALDTTQAADAAGVVLVGAIIGIGLLAHLVVPSRTARVGILLPPALLIASGAALAPLPVMLATVAATGVCQTLMVSAKPVMLLSRIDGRPSYGPADLLRLSAVLLPLHFALILAFASLIWPLMGVDLKVGPS